MLADDRASNGGRRWAARAALAVALIAPVFVYWQALDSAFTGDDYLLLVASRDMSWGEFLRATWDPGADPGILRLSADYWRPLSFLAFRVGYVLWGGDPWPYHVVNLAIHLAGVSLVYLLAARLTRSSAGAVVAALVFALHPAGVESVAWIAAVNSAGLPLALAAWLVFALAIERSPGPERRRLLLASASLTIAALAFRETASVVIAAMVAWYLLVPARGQLWTRDTAMVLAGPLAIAGVHAVVFAGVFSTGEGAGSLIDADSGTAGRFWFYVRQALLPMDANGRPVFLWAQRALGVAVLAFPLVVLARREWLLFALSAGFLVALGPYAAFSIGYGPRYFYFPSALLALWLGAVAAAAPRYLPAWDRSALARASVTGAAALATVAAALIGFQRVDRWVEENPQRQQAWVEALKAEYPELPPDGVLYVVNVPLIMALFEGYILEPTVAYHYPGDTRPVRLIEPKNVWYAEAIMEDSDRLFIFGEPEGIVRNEE